jgi:DNA end-binding protein Ku
LPESQDKELGRRSFWSGTITFGLVSIPVALLPAHRGGGVSLRMLSTDGTPLVRRYYCPRENRPVEREEIVRGFEIRKDEFVVVTDEELEALEPKKSREIDLRRFVPLERIDPSLFDRPYFLVPSGQSAKPYRLLAKTMERTGRAGIATFVMRTKEYLVAIIAENGILRAETLRFADEIRSADRLGIPEPSAASEESVRRIGREIRKATRDELDPDELTDHEARRLHELALKKRAAGIGVIRPEEGELSPVGGQEEEREGNVIDIMHLLKQSLGSRPAEKDRSEGSSGRIADEEETLQGMSRSELYERAKELNIPRRSSMSREELAEAIRRWEVREEEVS